MFRTADLIKQTRLEKGHQVEEISKKLKIPQKYLQAIEDEDVTSFPQEPYCSLIIKDYAQYLGLDGGEILRLFRRDFAVKKNQKPKTRKLFSFTPQFTFTVLVIISLVIFSSYLIFEYIKFNRPPQLTVNWPSSNISLESEINLSGHTDSESTVRVNQDLVIVDIDGNFTKKLYLQAGFNEITVESKSPVGITATTSQIINFQQ